jgi:AcrR family transcriptional regulator
MGITERKERERQEVRKLILDSAMKLFLEEGYKNVTIRKIAKQIEYSPGTIYLYFKDKDDILYTLQSIAFEKFHKAQSSVQDIPEPGERLIAHGKAYIKFALNNKEYYDLMFIMSEPLSKICEPQEWTTGLNSYNLLKQNIKDCVNAGVFHFEDIETAAFAFWSFVHGICSLVIKRGMIFPQEYIDYLVNGAFESFVSNIKEKK